MAPDHWKRLSGMHGWFVDTRRFCLADGTGISGGYKGKILSRSSSNSTPMLAQVTTSLCSPGCLGLGVPHLPACVDGEGDVRPQFGGYVQPW